MAFKRGYETFKEYVSPLTETLVGYFTDLKDGLSKIVTFFFGGQGEAGDPKLFFEGIKTLFLDLTCQGNIIYWPRYYCCIRYSIVGTWY